MLRLNRLSTFGVLACASASQAQGSTKFEMCKEPRGSSIVLDLDSGIGRFEDYSTNVRSCDVRGLTCISFPLIISIPPKETFKRRLSTWRIGRFGFSMAQKLVPGEYAIVATEWQRGHAGAVYRKRVMRIEYGDREGVRSLQVQGIPGRWVTCQGKLTFGDLKRLRVIE
jgi:hypothetical protein